MAAQVAFTLEQLARLPEDETRYEIDEGKLIALPIPVRRHGRCQARLAQLLLNFVTASCSGEVYLSTGFVLQRDPDTLRGPDVAFVSASRCFAAPDDVWPEFSPDLVIEVISPSETAREMDRKVRQYLAAGSQTVWVVYPDSRSVHVFEPNHFAVVEQTGTLTTPVLPGFELSVAAIFED